MEQKPKSRKKNIFRNLLPISSVLCFAFTVLYFNSKTYCLTLKCNDQTVVTMPDQKIFEKAKHSVLSEVLPNEKTKIQNLDTKLEITELNNSNSDNNYSENIEIIKDKIVKSTDENFVPGYALYVNQNNILASNSKENIDSCLENIKNKYKSEINPEYEITDISFDEDIEIKSGMFPANKIKNTEQITKVLNTKVQKTGFYTINNNESMSDISQKFDTNIQTLCMLNNKNKFYYGDKIIVPIYDDLLHVNITCESTEHEDIPFESIVTEDQNIERGIENITQVGAVGIRELKHEIVYKQGLEFSKNLISNIVLAEPVEAKITIGTKAEEWLWPVPFTKKITSPYGPRAGGFHHGIDIAKKNVYGTNILAAKAGTVEKVCHSNIGYGNHVIIKHDNKTKTLYAHCKDIKATVGKKVNQGDIIATVGSTGDSDGAHLHFEIRINNSQVNPSLYIK